MEIIVDKNYHLSRIDRFIREYFSVPQSLVSKLIREKKIKINKKKSEISTLLHEGDVISLYYFLEKNASSFEKVSPQLVENFKKWIIYEDEDLIIINKPHGISSQGGVVSGISVDVLAKSYFSEARITHRIDRETSGILVIAKSKFIARNITTLFAESKVVKRYHAVVNKGINGSGKIITDLNKDAFMQKMVVCEGSSCVTNYRVLQENERYSLLEITPETGKMHQIRVHLASIGFPILGDEKYGGEQHKRMFLNASSIEFEDKYFKVELPKEFISLGFAI